MLKRAIPLLIHGANQTGVTSTSGNSSTDLLDGRDTNSRLVQWVPELNPIRWLIINIMWCIAYAIPLVALFWRTKNEFFYSAAFYLTVNIVSCITWVAQTILSAYWFWNNLGWARGIELCLSLYFVSDALLIIFLRDTSKLSTADVVLDYGVSLFAYIWAVEIGIKMYLETTTTQGIATTPTSIEERRTTGYQRPCISSLTNDPSDHQNDP